MRAHVRIELSDPTHVAVARRAAAALAAELAFCELQAGKAAIVVTEAAANVVRHATRGELLIAPLQSGLEILAIDRGPGMADVAQCLIDGYTTIGGSRGEGLGAIKRQSTRLEIYSQPNAGTVLLAHVPADSPPPVYSPPRAALELGTVEVCHPSETVSGDNWSAIIGEHHLRAVVADGLGHGPDAAIAAGRAIDLFMANAQLSAADIIQRAHKELEKTRGAAMAIADVDLDARELRFTGVGNISAVVLTGTKRHSMASHNGTVGAAMRTVQTFAAPFADRSILIMSSDGLQSRWSLEAYPGLTESHPSLIAAVLYRDFKRVNKDDVTVLVAKMGRRAA